MHDALETTKDWRSRMLNKQLYVVFARAIGRGDRSHLLQAHLTYMSDLEEQGVLFAAGPFVDEEGSPSGDGLLVLRANSTAKAVELAQADPYVKAGLRAAEVRPWRVMEGTVTVRLSYATGTFRLD